MSRIAIIPARGGSKRIPLKNIKDFAGKPIISYSIEAAINSNLFDKVIVSTDSETISDISKSYGAEIPFFRSEINSNDFATTADVINEVIDRLSKENNLKYDSICCIYPTAPFVTSEKLLKSYNIFIQYGADSLIPVVKYSYPPQRSFIIMNNQLKFLYPEYLNSRSQDLEPIYHDAGQFYWLKSSSVKSNKSLIGKKSIPFVLKDIEAQDIDSIQDWEIAEIKYNTLFISKSFNND